MSRVVLNVKRSQKYVCLLVAFGESRSRPSQVRVYRGVVGDRRSGPVLHEPLQGREVGVSPLLWGKTQLSPCARAVSLLAQMLAVHSTWCGSRLQGAWFPPWEPGSWKAVGWLSSRLWCVEARSVGVDRVPGCVLQRIAFSSGQCTVQ